MKAWGRQQWMVAALVVLLVYLVWSRLIAPNLGGGAGTQRGAGGRSFEGGEIVELRSDLLQPQTGVYKSSRNVFAYHHNPQPKPPEPKPQPKPVDTEPKPQQAVKKEPPAPKPPQFAMRYLGSFGPRDQPIAVFIDGEDLYNLRVGEVVKDEFVLVKVGFESADIGFVNFPDVEPKRVGIAGS